MGRRSWTVPMGIGVFVVLLLLFFAGGVDSLHGQQEAKTVWVRITPGATPQDPPSVDVSERHVSKKNSEQVCWKLTEGTHFQVNFKGVTPFHGKHIFTDQDTCSGLPDVPGDGTTTYKYSVSVNGGKALDPTVIVDP